MALSLSRMNKHVKRTELKKSHSWWWDSHVSSKNSKWLAENLEEMDQSIKRMLKLIEEDADSFAKKAEMYYQKRPELISLVEEFYRMYQSLADRYDHVTGELRKNIPSDLQSQGSGISDVGSELASAWPSPDQRLTRRKSGPRAAGFEFFLGSGGSGSDLCTKEGDETSTLDSESESDDSSVNNYSGASNNGDGQGFRRRIIELEVELRDVKEKLRVQREENLENSFRGHTNGNSENLLTKIAEYDEELRLAKEKISVKEIAMLNTELKKYKSSGLTGNLQGNEEVSTVGSDHLEVELCDPECKIQKTLEAELKFTKEKLRDSEKEVANLKREIESNLTSIRGLQDKLGLAQKEGTLSKGKLDREKREVSKLQDRIARYKANLSDRDQEIRGLEENISNANKSLSDKNSQLQAEICKLSKERAYLEDNLKEWEFRCQSLEDEVRRTKAGKTEMQDFLGAEIEKLKSAIVERGERIEELNKTLDEYKLKYDMVIAKRDELLAEVSCRDDRIEQMNADADKLRSEHAELISGTQTAVKQAEELRSRVEELESEVGRQKVVISERAEEKREAIRQLCFSLEHYRDGYRTLQQAFVGHKRLPIMAS